MATLADRAPADLAAYWDETEAELAALPAAPTVEWVPMRSTATYDYFELYLTSLGAQRVFGWLSRPKGPGHFPAVLFAPRYGSVVNPPPSWARERYVTLSICARGQRHSDSPQPGMFPGYMTTGCDDPQRFIYRGVVCDLLRAVDHVAGMIEVDRTRIALHSADPIAANLALIAAARRPFLNCLALNTPAWVDLAAVLPQTQAYPVAELHHYFRAYPERRAAALRTFAYYDALAHAPAVRAAVLLKQNPAPRTLAAALAGARLVDLHDAIDYLHGRYQTAWMEAQLA